MDAATKDLFQVGAWLMAIVGGAIAAWKAIVEWRRANEHRDVDLLWRKAEMAKRSLAELFANEHARAALKMLDWDGQSYKLDGATIGAVTHEKRRDSLRTTDTSFEPGDVGPVIRDAYDALFDHLERLEHYVRIGLIRFEDIGDALRYYVEKMAAPDERPVLVRFMETYGFAQALKFLARFPEWERSR